MTRPPVDRKLTDQLREWMRALHDYVEQEIDERPPEEIIERVLAALSAIVAAGMLVAPKLRKEGLLTLLITILTRFLGRPRKTVVEHELDRHD